MFRSTGSYEPDPLDAKMSSQVNSFDPQALTSLTGDGKATILEVSSFDPQALTSLTFYRWKRSRFVCKFRSTGSYEPDQTA